MSKNNKSSKSEMIRIFAESLDKNCRTTEDIVRVIKCINEYAEFMSKQKRHKKGFILDILTIKEFLYEESGSRKMLDNLTIIADEFIGAMMIADRYKKENDLLLEIANDPALII